MGGRRPLAGMYLPVQDTAPERAQEMPFPPPLRPLLLLSSFSATGAAIPYEVAGSAG